MTYASLTGYGSPYYGEKGREELDRLLAGGGQLDEDEIARRNTETFQALMRGGG